MDNKVYVVFILENTNKKESEFKPIYLGGVYGSLEMAVKAIKDDNGEEESYNPGKQYKFYNKKDDKFYLIYEAPMGYPIGVCHIAKYED